MLNVFIFSFIRNM